MLFYDFEVFKHDWLVVILDTEAQEKITIVNDREKLLEFYEAHVQDVWVGFNSRNYDQYILKGILLDMNPKEINDFIIQDGKRGYDFSSAFRKIKLNNYDVMQNIDRGLKVFEGFMGNSIVESSVDFMLERPLTEEEIQETIKYCSHDVEQTMEIFIERYSDFEAQMGLLKMFELPLEYINKTKVQLAATILEARKNESLAKDEFKIHIPETLQIKKYKMVADWYMNPDNRDYDKSLEIEVAGVKHEFAWGGVHGAREKYSSEGYFLMMDVASLYPSLMIEYDLLSRSCNPEKFKDIVATRLKFKAEKNPLQAPLKIVINGTYGAMKDKRNGLYDPMMANNVCLHGQLLLLDLIEHLEPYCELIQSNTDGILIKMPEGKNPDEWYSLVDDIAYEWETRTHLKLEFDEYQKVYQKDVNNYLIIDAEGHAKSKGAYLKKLSRLDYDMPIVNKAMSLFLKEGIPVEKTIMDCDDLIEFQIVKKISAKYEGLYTNAFYNGTKSKRRLLYHKLKKSNEKTVRVFASKDKTKGGLVKLHKETHRFAKIENTPEHCFIYNESVIGVKCPDELDKGWYIQKALDRLEDFGVLRG